MSLFRRMQIRVKSKLCKDRHKERQETNQCSFFKPENIFAEAGSCENKCPIYKKTCYRWDLCYIAKQYVQRESCGE